MLTNAEEAGRSTAIENSKAQGKSNLKSPREASQEQVLTEKQRTT